MLAWKLPGSLGWALGPTEWQSRACPGCAGMHVKLHGTNTPQNHVEMPSMLHNTLGIYAVTLSNDHAIKHADCRYRWSLCQLTLPTDQLTAFPFCDVCYALHAGEGHVQVYGTPATAACQHHRDLQEPQLRLPKGTIGDQVSCRS